MSTRPTLTLSTRQELADLDATYTVGELTGPKAKHEHYRAQILDVKTGRVLATAEAYEDDISAPERTAFGKNANVVLARAIAAAKKERNTHDAD